MNKTIDLKKMKKERKKDRVSLFHIKAIKNIKNT